MISSTDADLHLHDGSETKYEIKSYDSELNLSTAKIENSGSKFLFFDGRQNTKTHVFVIISTQEYINQRRGLITGCFESHIQANIFED